MAAAASLLLLSLSLFTPFAPFASDPCTLAVASDSRKVSLGVYYEALCPYSANFIVKYLANIFRDGLSSIVELNLVPYGNARLGPNGTITCQHGPSECLLNTIEACGIHAWPDVNDHFPFIYCIESFVHDHNYRAWLKCFEKLMLDPEPIIACYAGGHGKTLELQYAAETDALQPPHTYVPWVVVDGQPLYEDYEEFESYVCKAYKGTAAPETCGESKKVRAPFIAEASTARVTGAEETTWEAAFSS